MRQVFIECRRLLIAKQMLIEERLQHKDLVSESLSEKAYCQMEIRLAMVLLALKRLESATYGFCIDCGNEIDDQRLVLVPETERCLQCQRTYEGSGLNNYQD